MSHLSHKKWVIRKGAIVSGPEKQGLGATCLGGASLLAAQGGQRHGARGSSVGSIYVSLGPWLAKSAIFMGYLWDISMGFLWGIYGIYLWDIYIYY